MFRTLSERDPDDSWTGLSAPTLIVTGSLDNSHQRALELRDHIDGLSASFRFTALKQSRGVAQLRQ